MDGILIGDQLKAARKLRGVKTTRVLAGMVNRPRFGEKVIGQIERNDRKAQPHEVEWLAEALGIPDAYLTTTPAAPGQDDLASLADLIRQDIADRQRQRNEIIARLDKLERAILDGTREINDETAARLLRLGQAVVQGQPLEEGEPSPQPDRGRRRGDATKRAAKSRTPSRP